VTFRILKCIFKWINLLCLTDINVQHDASHIFLFKFICKFLTNFILSCWFQGLARFSAGKRKTDQKRTRNKKRFEAVNGKQLLLNNLFMVPLCLAIFSSIKDLCEKESWLFMIMISGTPIHISIYLSSNLFDVVWAALICNSDSNSCLCKPDTVFGVRSKEEFYVQVDQTGLERTFLRSKTAFILSY